MVTAIITILQNKIFLASVLAWLIAQVLKIIIYARKNRRINFRLLLGSGGMPSSHSATVMALSTAVGKIHGWDTPLFIVTLIFAFIIMTDAVGVRRAVGQQARILNIMVDELYEKGTISERRLKELLGHTPVEVFVGAGLGILVALGITAL
ncbi:MAG: divergent PAP2 family protein [bacterium]